MLIIVTDSYNYKGYFNNAMCEISDDYKLMNIRRFNEKYQIIENITNSCSSKDAMDIDIYSIDSEEKLVYYSDETSIIDNADVFYTRWKKVSLTFNNKSFKYKDEVIQKIKENLGNALLSLDVVILDSFEDSEKEVDTMVKYWFGSETFFDFEKMSIVYPKYDFGNSEENTGTIKEFEFDDDGCPF